MAGSADLVQLLLRLVQFLAQVLYQVRQVLPQGPFQLYLQAAHPPDEIPGLWQEGGIANGSRPGLGGGIGRCTGSA